MKSYRTLAMIISAAVAAAVAYPLLASAQDANVRAVEDYTCKDVMREGGSSRDVAIAFLHGYLLGKSNGNKVDVETMGKQTDAFMEQCLDNPAQSALATMIKIKGTP
jgi:hypothetical protein